MEGLGELKRFVKVRNPLTLNKAIQAIENETKKLQSGNKPNKKKMGSTYNICKWIGH